jgi:hypothetical protein
MRKPKTDRLTARNPRIAVSSLPGQVKLTFYDDVLCPLNRGNLTGFSYLHEPCFQVFLIDHF